MIRANDKGLNNAPAVVDEPPKPGLVNGRNLIILVGIVAWIAVLLLFVVPNLGKKSTPESAAPPAAAAAATTNTGTAAAAATGATAGVASGPKAVPLPQLEIDNRVINLAGNAAGYKYVKLSLIVQFQDPKGQYAKADGASLAKLQQTFAANNAGALVAFNDIVTSTVSTKTAADLSTPQGKEALRQELIQKFNAATSGSDNRVAYVLFTDFVMQ